MNDTNNNGLQQPIQKKPSNIDIKGKKVAEYSGINDNLPPLSKSAPQKNWSDEQPSLAGGRKKGENNMPETRRFSIHDDPEPEAIRPTNENEPKQHQKQEQHPYYHQRYRRKAPPSPFHDPFLRSSPMPMRMDQFSIQEIHQLIDENQALHYELETMHHQFQMEKLEYQRRLRHLNARLQYLEETKRRGQSPDEYFHDYKPYEKKMYKRKPQAKNEQDEDATAEQPRYVKSPDPMMYHENSSKKRHFPPPPRFPFDDRGAFYDYEFMDRYGMMPPPPPPMLPNANSNSNSRRMFEQEERMPYMRYFYEGSPFVRHEFSDNEDDLDEEEHSQDRELPLDPEAEDLVLNEFYQRPGSRYGPPPPPPPPPQLGMHPPAPPPPGAFMSGPPPPPPPMMYGRPWMNNFSPYSEGRVSRRSSQHEKSKKSPIITKNDYPPDDEDIEIMIHQMSLAGGAAGGPPPPPPPPPPNMMPPMMYRDLPPPMYKAPLRRVSSRRSVPGEYPNGGGNSSRSSFIDM